MLFNKEKIDSCIGLDTDTWLYEVKLPWIKRQFESVYYSFEWVSKSYWKLVYKFIWKDLNNKLLWITTFYDNYIICFIDLNNLSSKYIYAKSFDYIDFKLAWKKCDTFIFTDLDDKKSYITSYVWKDYILDIKNNYFIIKNSIFDTKVLSKQLNLDNKLKDDLVISTDNNQYLDIADFFIFDDYFYNSFGYKEFKKFLDLFVQKNIKVNEDLKLKIKSYNYKNLYYPKIRINLSIYTNNSKKIDLLGFRKLLLSFYPENTLTYIINNDSIKKYFSDYFKDMSSYIIKDINLKFDLPKDIFVWDIKFKKFKDDLLILRYNYFKLKENLKSIKKLKEIKNTNIKHINLTKIRWDITKQNLEKTLKLYENKLKELFSYMEKKNS